MYIHFTNFILFWVVVEILFLQSLGINYIYSQLNKKEEAYLVAFLISQIYKQ